MTALPGQRKPALQRNGQKTLLRYHWDGAAVSKGERREPKRYRRKNGPRSLGRRRFHAGVVTAEVAIITRQAVVLAADSAVTIGQRRVWKTANKLFW